MNIRTSLPSYLCQGKWDQIGPLLQYMRRTSLIYCKAKMDRGEMSRGQRIKRLVGDVTTCSLSRENRHISSSCHQATSCLCPTRRITCRLSGWGTFQEEDEDSESLRDVLVSHVGWSDRIISDRKLYFAVAHVQTIDLFSVAIWNISNSPAFADTSVWDASIIV